MRGLLVGLIAGLAVLVASTVAGSALEDCRTGDSAICLGDSKCHWDYERRGCYAGPPERSADACAAHGDKGICESDVTLGCKWSAANKCESSAE
jgi:hypothetical protein